MPFLADDLLLLGAAGVGAQGAGSLLSALYPPEGVGEVNPELVAYFQQQGLDINEAIANAQIANMHFGQRMSAYEPKVLQALQDTYNREYGDVERGARDYATSALRGEATPATKNLLARYGTEVGHQKGSGVANIKQRLAQMGIQPGSPAYASALSDAENAYQRQYLEGSSDIQTSQQQADLARAMQILQNAQTSNRLAGTQLPNAPLTEEERRQSALEGNIQTRIAKVGQTGKSMSSGLLGAMRKMEEMKRRELDNQQMGYVSHPSSYRLPTYVSGQGGVSALAPRPKNRAKKAFGDVVTSGMMESAFPGANVASHIPYVGKPIKGVKKGIKKVGKGIGKVFGF